MLVRSRTASSCCPTFAGTGRRSCSTAAATSRNIVCPIHRWTYDLRGELLGAPPFEDKPCLKLGRTPLANWNGLLFEGRATSAAISRRCGVENFDFSGYLLDRVEITRQLQLEIVHRGLSRGLPRRSVPSRVWASSSHATTCTGNSATGIRCRPSASTTGSQSREHQDVRALAQGRPRLLSRRRAAARRDLAHLLSEHHDRMVSARAHVSSLIPEAVDRTTQRRRVLLPRGNRVVRARIRRGRAGGVSGNREGGRRNRRADGCRAPRALPVGPQRIRAVPVADGRRHAALPRVLPA